MKVGRENKNNFHKKIPVCYNNSGTILANSEKNDK